jgi:hypothetical protein
VATAALAGALDLIAGLGGGTVEGYPEDAGSVPAGFLFNGALSTYEKLGFICDRKIGKHRWVVTRAVEPRSDKHGSEASPATQDRDPHSVPTKGGRNKGQHRETRGPPTVAYPGKSGISGRYE